MKIFDKNKVRKPLVADRNVFKCEMQDVLINHFQNVY